MLHITNGQSAIELLKAYEIEGEFLAWDDVLYEGPVPAGLDLEELSNTRAQFISMCGWASLEEAKRRFLKRDETLKNAIKVQEIIIWSSVELYDQLQLLQVLSLLYEQNLKEIDVSIVFIDTLFCSRDVSKAKTLELFFQRRPIDIKQLDLAHNIWDAFRSKTPHKFEFYLDVDLECLPFLKNAILRLMQEYPYTENGLSKTQQQILEAIECGCKNPVEVFRYSQQQESPPFMGDASFWLILNEMISSEYPLIKLKDQKEFIFLADARSKENFRNQELYLTPLGEAVLEKKADWLNYHEIDRYIGGVRLHGKPVWRFDDVTMVLQKK